MPRFVYRVIRADENPEEEGIRARNPNATYTATAHVAPGRNTLETQFIPTTTDYYVARDYAILTGNRIAHIDVREVLNAGLLFLDVRNGGSLTGFRAINYARASREVLFYGGVIPSSAVFVFSVRDE